MKEIFSSAPKRIVEQSDDELVLNMMLTTISNSHLAFMIRAVINAGYSGIDVPWIADSMIRQELEKSPKGNIARFCDLFTIEKIGHEVNLFTRCKVFRQDGDKYFLSDLAIKHLGRFEESLKIHEESVKKVGF